MNAAMLIDILRQRRWQFSFLALLLLLALGLVIFRTVWQEPRLAQLQHQWFASRELAAGVATSPAAVYGKGKEDLQRVRDFTPPRTQFVRLLSDIYEAAADNQLTVEEITYKPQQVKEKSIIAYGLTMKATGSYAAVKSFIADLERMRDLVVVDGFSVSGGKADMGNVVTLTLPLSAYFVTEAK